ncbi:class I SAM-dependent methyltransferase [Streptomyces sp. PKU-MA01144]|uniref:class I SAM-dependent methyltransferase n=1 Tax=Streptomyces sp. PKU-MA01144 TaxID=2729138 RepID=UPI00147AF25F|nr:class I SAM-dependent methyltransferase [Streptomyces sp. PKU-MA01144]NNJ05846.1 class I SAM-dependent methyltransferase [Streptomyces sp. PKU-MA01144]
MSPHEHTVPAGNPGNPGNHAHHGHHGHHVHDTTHIDWEEFAALLEREAALNLPLYEQVAHWVREQLPHGSVRRVLDVGSGPGAVSCLLAEVFPQAEVVAVDATPGLLELARARADRAGLADRFSTHVAELPDGIAELGPADLVWASGSLHHVGDQRAALTGLAGLLRPGGLLALLEGGLPARHLPRDIGIGRPGLESRLEAATAGWFADMRAVLPGAKPEVENWRALLAAAGLTPTLTRSFLLDLPAPVTDAVREGLVSGLSWQRRSLEGRLDADDAAVLDRLLDPDDEEGLMRRPDCFMLAARTVHTARRG